MATQPLPPPPSIYTAAALQSAEFPPLRAVIPGLLYSGFSLLAGKPKEGKSWLALQMAAAIAMGTPILERQVQAGPVLIVALEDGGRRVQSRLRKLLSDKGPWPECLHLANEWPRIGEGGEVYLRRWITSVRDPAAIFLDHFGLVRPIQTREYSYAGDQAAARAIKLIADEADIPIMAICHLRKRQEKAKLYDPIQEVNGTMGLVGAVDTICVLEREQRFQSTLFVTGRDVEDEETIQMRWHKTTQEWLLDETADLFATKERNEIATLLQQAPMPMTIREMELALPHIKYETLRKRCRRMLEAGQIYVAAGSGEHRYDITPEAMANVRIEPSWLRRLRGE